MYFSSKSVAPAALSTYDWRLRLDWDVVQRCLGVAFLAFLAYCVCNSPPLASVGFWVSPAVVWMILCLSLPLAVLKSAAVLPPSVVRGKSVLVTGCDTGFGLILAKRLQKMGATVFAGCLSKDSDGAKELDALSNVHTIKLDVTQDDDWESAYQYINKVCFFIVIIMSYVYSLFM